MIRREKLHALVLSRRKVGEADRLLMCLTKEYGLLQVRAAGVRKIPSRRGGHIEPFTHIFGIISGASGHIYVTGVETLDYYSALRADTSALDQAVGLTQTVAALLPPEEPEPALFDALHHAWQILPTVSAAKRAIVETAIYLCLLERVGIWPDLRQCHVCGIAQPTDAIILDSGRGGWRCLGCHTSFAGSRTSLSPRLLKVLRFLQQSPERALQLALPTEESEQLLAAVRQYMQTVLEDMHPAYSPAFTSYP